MTKEEAVKKISENTETIERLLEENKKLCIEHSLGFSINSIEIQGEPLEYEGWDFGEEDRGGDWVNSSLSC